MTKSKIIFSILALVALTNCGKSAQDPLHDYTVDDTAVPLHEKPNRTVAEMPRTHKIEAVDDLTFVQGRSRSVRFKVTLLGDFANETKYQLKTDRQLESLGAKFDSATGILTWAPPSNLLSHVEASRKINLELELDILGSSSARAKRVFSAVHRKSTFVVTVVKDSSVPQFSDKISLSKGSLSLGQRTEISFKVTAEVAATEDLVVSLNPDRQKPSRELLQAAGSYGIVDGPAVVAAKVSGASRTVTYRMTFDSQKFWERVLQDINADVNLRSKLRGAGFSKAEARLVIVVTNQKTKLSERREIIIDIDLGFSAGKPVLVATGEQLEVTPGKKKIETLSVRSENNRGNVSVTSISVNGVEGRLTQGTHKISSSVGEISLRCVNAKAADLNKCDTGICIVSCQMTVTPKACENSESVVNLQIKAQSEVRDQKVEDTITRQIKINKSQKACAGAQS